MVKGDWERYDLYLRVLEEVQEREDFLKTRSKSKMARQGNVRSDPSLPSGISEMCIWRWSAFVSTP